MLLLTMKKQPLIKILHKPAHPMAGKVVLGVGILLALGALIFVFQQSQAPTVTDHTTPSTSETVLSPTPSTLLTPTPSAKTFTSNDLGISFNYANDPQYTATEIGTKVFIHDVKLPPTSGFNLEVFSKAPADTIDVAIKKRFLQGITEGYCQIQIIPNLRKIVSPAPDYPSTYSIARIIYTNYESKGWMATENDNHFCPKPYSYGGNEGIIFFLADSNHPNKLIFINNGQSGISSGKQNESWYNTIRFLDTTTQ
jgi:hypothetical protein